MLPLVVLFPLLVELRLFPLMRYCLLLSLGLVIYGYPILPFVSIIPVDRLLPLIAESVAFPAINIPHPLIVFAF